ncbi:MAG: class I SAM-dependent methyltransferase [Bryobacteraceae bacterium]
MSNRVCPICEHELDFDSQFSRELQPIYCPYRTFSACITRERALAAALFGMYDRDTLKSMVIYECSPAFRGLSQYLRTQFKNYMPTGYFPGQPTGTVVHGLRNENLESLTLPDASVDIWLHLDVLEHLFDPFGAMREIERTLRPGGRCFFTAPTYPGRVKSVQVAFREADGRIRIVGDPEYHGNPQSPQGSLVTWRYGYDLPERIWHATGLEVEVRRGCMPSLGIAGPMTEVYVCTKPTA